MVFPNDFHNRDLMICLEDLWYNSTKVETYQYTVFGIMHILVFFRYHLVKDTNVIFEV